jgi:hypothetical protein
LPSKQKETNKLSSCLAWTSAERSTELTLNINFAPRMYQLFGEQKTAKDHFSIIFPSQKAFNKKASHIKRQIKYEKWLVRFRPTFAFLLLCVRHKNIYLISLICLSSYFLHPPFREF